MDPITTAILAALSAGAIKAAGALGQNAITDGYAALKALLKKKFGEQSDLVKSVENVEAKPDSTARKDMLKEEVASSQAEQDPEILKAAQALLEKIQQQPGGGAHIMQATGSYIAQADRGSNASVNVNAPKEK